MLKFLFRVNQVRVRDVVAVGLEEEGPLESVAVNGAHPGDGPEGVALEHVVMGKLPIRGFRGVRGGGRLVALGRLGFRRRGRGDLIGLGGLVRLGFRRRRGSEVVEIHALGLVLFRGGGFLGLDRGRGVHRGGGGMMSTWSAESLSSTTFFSFLDLEAGVGSKVGGARLSAASLPESRAFRASDSSWVCLGVDLSLSVEGGLSRDEMSGGAGGSSISAQTLVQAKRLRAAIQNPKAFPLKDILPPQVLGSRYQVPGLKKWVSGGYLATTVYPKKIKNENPKI